MIIILYLVVKEDSYSFKSPVKRDAAPLSLLNYNGGVMTSLSATSFAFLYNV